MAKSKKRSTARRGAAAMKLPKKAGIREPVGGHKSHVKKY